MINTNKINKNILNINFSKDSKEHEQQLKLSSVLLKLYGNCEMASHMTNKIKRERRESKHLKEARELAYSTYSAFKLVASHFTQKYSDMERISESEQVKYDSFIDKFSATYAEIDHKLRSLAITDIERTTAADLASSFESKIDFYTSEGCDKKQSVRKAFDESLNENVHAYFCLAMASAYDKNNSDYLVNISNVRFFENKARQSLTQCDFEMG